MTTAFAFDVHPSPMPPVLHDLPITVPPAAPLGSSTMFVYLSAGTVVELVAVTSVELTTDAIAFFDAAQEVARVPRADVWTTSRNRTCPRPD